MAIQIINRVASIALRGQCAKITIDATDVNKLPLIQVGQKVDIISSGASGTIAFVDYNGLSFLVKPNTLSDSLESDSGFGYIVQEEEIIIN